MNKRLLVLSGLAILAVVANHTSHIGFIAMFWWTDRYLPVMVPNFDQMGSLAYYGLVAQQKLALFSVPSFLFVSGAFIAYAARGGQSRLSWGMIQKRIVNLIPPYLVWTTVFLLSEFILGARYTWSELVLSFVTISQSPFFFVPLLMVFFALSPLLAPLAKSRWQLLLGIGLTIEAIAITRAYLRLLGITYPLSSTVDFLFGGQIAEYFIYYTLGLILGFRLGQIKEGLYKLRWALLASTLILAALAVVEAEWAFRQYDNAVWRSLTQTLPTFLYAISFIFCFLAFERSELPFSNLLYRIGTGTLAIYLLHKTILLFLPKIVYHAAPFVLGHQILLQPLLIGIAIGAPMLLMELVRRSPLRKRYRFLFG